MPLETMGGHMLVACEDSRSNMAVFSTMGAPFVAHHAASEQSNHGLLLDEDIFHGSLGGMSMGGIFPAGNSRDATAVSHSLGPCIMDSRDCHSFPGLMSPPQHSRHVPVTVEAVLVGPAPSPRSHPAKLATGALPNAFHSPKQQPHTTHFPISVMATPAATPGGPMPSPATGKASRGSPGEGGTGEKKPQGTWTADENRSFFNALRSHGRSFDLILEHMGATKTREQVSLLRTSCQLRGHIFNRSALRLPAAQPTWSESAWGWVVVVPDLCLHRCAATTIESSRRSIRCSPPPLAPPLPSLLRDRPWIGWDMPAHS